MRLLAYRESNGLRPWNAPQLAEAIGLTDPSVIYKWEKRGSVPLSHTGQKVARALEVDYSWLSDPTRPFEDPDSGVSFDTAWSLIPPEEKKELGRILANPVERKAWIAQWHARHGRP